MTVNNNDISREDKKKLAKIRTIINEYNIIVKAKKGGEVNMILPNTPMDILVTVMVKYLG